MDFSGKTDSIILLGLESNTKLSNLMKIVDAILEKIGIFIFLFLCELLLILVVGGKLKMKGLGYLQRTPTIEFQQYRSIGLGAMFSDCHRDRWTDKWTFFLKHFLKVKDSYRMEIHK